jgi:hypothetical protein
MPKFRPVSPSLLAIKFFPMCLDSSLYDVLCLLSIICHNFRLPTPCHIVNDYSKLFAPSYPLIYSRGHHSTAPEVSFFWRWFAVAWWDNTSCWKVRLYVMFEMGFSEDEWSEGIVSGCLVVFCMLGVEMGWGMGMWITIWRDCRLNKEGGGGEGKWMLLGCIQGSDWGRNKIEPWVTWTGWR